MIGGRLVNVLHIGGVPVQMKRMSHSHRRYVRHTGSGFFDDMWSGIKMVAENPLVQGIAKVGIKALTGGSVAKQQLTREQILSEIAGTLNGSRRRKN